MLLFTICDILTYKVYNIINASFIGVKYMDNIEEQILSLGTNRLARYIINTSTSKDINEIYQE